MQPGKASQQFYKNPTFFKGVDCMHSVFVFVCGPKVSLIFSNHMTWDTRHLITQHIQSCDNLSACTLYLFLFVVPKFLWSFPTIWLEINGISSFIFISIHHHHHCCYSTTWFGFSWDDVSDGLWGLLFDFSCKICFKMALLMDGTYLSSFNSILYQWTEEHFNNNLDEEFLFKSWCYLLNY